MVNNSNNLGPASFSNAGLPLNAGTLAIKATRAPRVTDKAYPLGQLWTNTSTSVVYVLASVTNNQATWTDITGATEGYVVGPATSVAGNVAIWDNTTGTLLADSGAALPLTVSNGGTGDASFTPYALLAAGTTSTSALQNVSGLGTSGFVLTSQGAGALPVWASRNLPFTLTTTASFTAATNHGYFLDLGASAGTITLPATSAVGDMIELVGISGSGPWTIAQQAGQYIAFNGFTTTTGVGGSLTANAATNTIQLKCFIANTAWVFTNGVSNQYTGV